MGRKFGELIFLQIFRKHANLHRVLPLHHLRQRFPMINFNQIHHHHHHHYHHIDGQVLLLRRDYEEEERNVFKPAEWRWTIPQVVTIMIIMMIIMIMTMISIMKVHLDLHAKANIRFKSKYESSLADLLDFLFEDRCF